MGAFAPQLEAPPPLSPCQKKKMVKISHFGQILDFCALRNAFCPLDAPPHKKKKKIWCRHWTTGQNLQTLPPPKKNFFQNSKLYTRKHLLLYAVCVTPESYITLELGLCVAQSSQSQQFACFFKEKEKKLLFIC